MMIWLVLFLFQSVQEKNWDNFWFVFPFFQSAILFLFEKTNWTIEIFRTVKFCPAFFIVFNYFCGQIEFINKETKAIEIVTEKQCKKSAVAKIPERITSI